MIRLRPLLLAALTLAVAAVPLLGTPHAHVAGAGVPAEAPRVAQVHAHGSGASHHHGRSEEPVPAPENLETGGSLVTMRFVDEYLSPLTADGATDARPGLALDRSPERGELARAPQAPSQRPESHAARGRPETAPQSLRAPPAHNV